MDDHKDNLGKTQRKKYVPEAKSLKNNSTRLNSEVNSDADSEMLKNLDLLMDYELLQSEDIELLDDLGQTLDSTSEGEKEHENESP